MTEPESAVLKPLHYRERVCQRRRQPTRLLYTSSCDATAEGQMAVWVFRCPYRLLSPLAAGAGHLTPACPWLPRDAVWHSRLTTRTARCRLGPTPFGANIRYSKCASRLGHCAVSRADSAASRGSARRRKLNWLRVVWEERRGQSSPRGKTRLAATGLSRAQ